MVVKQYLFVSFSLIRHLLLTWLSPMEVAPAIGLPQVLPCSESRAIVGTACASPHWTHYAHGLTLPRKRRNGGLAQGAILPG